MARSTAAFMTAGAPPRRLECQQPRETALNLPPGAAFCKEGLDMEGGENKLDFGLVLVSASPSERRSAR